MESCACGTHKNYSECCELFITGKALPTTPEELMRSRYTAYTKANVDYIQRTMKSPASDHFNANEALAWAERVEWLKLEVLSATQQDDTGTVEFIAHFIQNKQHHVLHELSDFRCDEGEWFYISGKDPGRRAQLPIKMQHVGRNDACLCGSGKKYKRCCGSVG